MTRSTALRLGLGMIAVAAATISLGRALPSLTTLQSTVQSASWTWVLAAAVLQFGSIAMLVRQQRRLLRALGTPVPLHRMAGITYSSTALAISLPAGAAVSAGYSFRQFRASGATPRSAGLTLLLSGLLSVGSLLVIFAIGWTVASAAGPDGVIATHPVVAASFALVFISLTIALARLLERRRTAASSDRTPRLDALERRHSRIGNIVRKLWNLLQDTRTVRPGDWNLAIGSSAGKWLLDAACLYACAQAVGVQLAALDVIGVYLGVQVVRQIPLTPGGIGLVEVALIAALVTAGAAAGPAAAVTIIYRLFSAWVLIPVGYVLLLLTRADHARRNANTASTRRLSSAPWYSPSLVKTPRT
jgi:uncharacterized protein (TIRG00374 family)